MSNFECEKCGMINIDCGKEGYKTPREIELEKENETLKSLNKHLTENGLFSQRHFKEENEMLKEKLEPTEEICPCCDGVINLPPYLGIYKCPECGEFIISCSICENHDCNNCDYDKATSALQKMKEVKNEHI